MDEPFEPGAWIEDCDHRCPKCGAVAIFAWDFKGGGKKQVRACKPCGALYINSMMAESLIHKTED